MDLPALAARRIRDIPDYPQPGVMFKDITPLLADRTAFSGVVDAMVAFRGAHTVDVVVGVEARGFILAAPVAYHMGAGFVPVRKGGKLPAATLHEDYALEYGTGVMELHADALEPGARVLVVDDVLATGGTAAAAVSLVRQTGADVVGVAVLIEIAALGGRSALPGLDVHALLTY